MTGQRVLSSMEGPLSELSEGGKESAGGLSPKGSGRKTVQTQTGAARSPSGWAGTTGCGVVGKKTTGHNLKWHLKEQQDPRQEGVVGRVVERIVAAERCDG